MNRLRCLLLCVLALLCVTDRVEAHGLTDPVLRDLLARPVRETNVGEVLGAIRAQTRQHIASMQQQANAVFENFLDLVGRPQRRFTLPSREWA